MVLTWDDLKQQAVRNGARFRDIPSLARRAARETLEFCQQEETQDDNELLTRQLGLILMDGSWMNEAAALSAMGFMRILNCQ